MKYKKGDSVRILPSAVEVNVASWAVGRTGVVQYDSPSGNCITVLMDKPHYKGGYRIDWVVEYSQIEPVIKVGQQLLLWEDI